MKKFKKLTLAAVSVVMAGTMAASFAACGGGGGSGSGGGGGGSGEKFDYYGVLNEDGTLNYNTYAERGNVKLNIAIGYSGLNNSTSYLDLTQTITLPDGVTYNAKQFKPAWVQMGKDLNITWNDVWDGTGTGKNIDGLVGSNKYATTDIFTTDLSVAVSQKKNNNRNILNLAQYLNRMPNFKNFLTQNPIVYLSLLQAGMNTSTGANQEIIVAPYFDGYDDIERYCIVRHDWAEKLLNGSTAGASTTFATACASSTSAKSFMGSTDYTVDALKDDTGATIKIKKNYSKALEEVKGSGALATAYKAIHSAGYSGNSGNIIDIMNAALSANANATGAQLLDLFRAYIDVAFTVGDSTTPAYSADNRANLFIGYNACWDVDDLVAMLRCVKTNASIISDSSFSGVVGGIAPRDGNAERLAALVSLACQLYGVRGGTSRNEFTYIDKSGALQDAREDKDFYKAMANMNDLYKEGLLADFSDGSSFVTESGIGTGKSINENDEYFFVYDYSQTQTLYGFYASGDITGTDLPDGYHFAPIINPVSKWDVDGNNTISADEYFRFTESWRSTKTGGLAVNGDVAKDEKKLEAVLEFIDYLYSEDGQIVSTFGPMAKADYSEGFWYDEVATAEQVAAGEYFTYKGVKYHGTEYKERYTPTVTPDLIRSFQGKSTTHSKGWKIGGNLIKAQLSFTDYARMLIGSTLPMGVKDQSFENQLTSKMGKEGADVVGLAIKKGVVRGMSLNINDAKKKAEHSWYTADNYWWYTCVPTSLPVTDAFLASISDANHLLFQHLTGTAGGGEKDFLSIMNWIMLKGTSGKYAEQDVEITFNGIDDLLTKGLGTATVAQLAAARRTVYNTAWTTAKSYWNYLSSLAN